MRRIRQKEGVILTDKHLSCAIKNIISAADRCFPEEVDLIITRGCEEAPGGKETSKHLYPGCAALDFRTRHLRSLAGRQEIVDEMQEILGSDYYGYYGKKSGAEWIHFQYNEEEKK